MGVKDANLDRRVGIVSSGLAFLPQEKAAEVISQIGGADLSEWISFPVDSERLKDKSDHGGTHINIKNFVKNPIKETEDYAKIMNKYNLAGIIGAYERILSKNDKKDNSSMNHILRNIDFASAIGGKNAGVSVGFFWGYNRNKNAWWNIDELTKRLYTIAKYAQEKDVVITTETCHMQGGWSPKNDMNLPPAVMRNASATYVIRQFVMQNLIAMGISPETLGITHDSSHAISQMGDWELQAKLSMGEYKNSGYPAENIISDHVKEHFFSPEELKRAAANNMPMLAGIFADPNNKRHQQAAKYGIGDLVGFNGWMQGAGWPAMPGCDVYQGTNYEGKRIKICEGLTTHEIIKMQNKNGIIVPLYLEDESPGKAKANEIRGEKGTEMMLDRYRKQIDNLAPTIWANGKDYQGTHKIQQVKPADKIEIGPNITALYEQFNTEGNFRKYMSQFKNQKQ